MIDLNATQAAIRAGYSENTAQQIGSENLLKPLIAEAIQKVLDEKAKKARKTADEVLKGIADIAFSSETDTDGKPKVQARDKLKGFELYGKYLRLFTDKLELDGDLTIIMKEYPKETLED